MTTESDTLVIKAVKSKRRRRYHLGRLIDSITEENRHSEIDWGPAAGNEAW
jgi:antitoxin component of MazEF toxin-antitoxin module